MDKEQVDTKVSHLAGDRKYDLWDSLMNTFSLFEDWYISRKPGIEPLAGSLFS
jgi:hypothetical protein